MWQPSPFALAWLVFGAAILTAQGSKYPATTLLTTTAPPSVPTGQQIPLMASVVDSNGYVIPTSGAIQFTDGAANLGQAIVAPTGVATLSVTLAPGSHNLRAQFGGDAGLAASSSVVIVQTATAVACPQLVFIQSPGASMSGANLGPVSVQVVCGPAVPTVSLTPLGLGGFKPGSVTTAQVVNGVATFNNLAITTPGSYTLAAAAPGATGAVSNSFSIAPPASASTFLVTNNTDSGAGSFRDAFNQANLRGGVIVFAAGMIGTIPLASALPQINSDIQIVGPGPRVLTISGANQFRVLFVQSGTVTISGVTLADGISGDASDAMGSGVENFSPSGVTIDNCIVSNNSSPLAGTSGGGIYNHGKMVIANSTVSGNRSGSGGGIDNAGSLTINNSLISANMSTSSSGAGGAILNETGAALTIQNSTISGNIAAASAGAVMNLGSVSITDSTLTKNEAHGSGGAGGALLNQTGAAASIVRSSILTNLSLGDGGGIANTTSGSVSLVNSTLAGNIASGIGGALDNRATGIAAISNSTIFGNTSLAGSGIYNQGNGSQLSLQNSIVSGNLNSLSSLADDCVGCGFTSSTNLIGGDAGLGTLQNNGGPTPTLLPLPGSPAIGAGTASSAAPTDQRGLPRPAAPGQSGGVDYGAVQTSYGLAFLLQPANAALGSFVTTAVQLQESGRPFAPAANLPAGGKPPLAFTVNLALASGTGAVSGSAGSVDPSTGVASFTALQLDTTGNKTLRASVPGFASATSQQFAISSAPTIPASILPTAGNGQSAAVNSNFATLLQVVVRDPSGNPLPGLTVIFTAVSGAAFATSSPTSAITDASGTATATALTAGSVPGPAVITATIQGYGLQAMFTLTVTQDPNSPAITASGFLNAASFLSTPAAPNTIVAVFGTFPCGSSAGLLVNGRSAEILSAAPTQVNFTVPASVAGSSTAAVQAACGTVVSQTIQLPVAASAPAIFTITQTGKGQAAALNQDAVPNSTLNPAATGSIVSVYVTGFGPFNAAGADGLERTALPVQAFLGGVQATIQYAGNSPGFTPGLQQVNIVVPAGVSGLATPLVLLAGGDNTQPGVTLAIQ